MGLPAVAAADVSPAGAGSSRTHLPGPRLAAAPRGLSGCGGVAANSRASTALGEPGTRGRGRVRKAPACSRRPGRSHREPRLEEPGALARLSPAAAASLFYPSELQSASGTARGEQPIEPLSGKSASPDEFLQ